jgi:hypothetical protein
MNHPFSLSTAELAIADLSFDESVEQAGVIGGSAFVVDHRLVTYGPFSESGRPFPIHEPYDLPSHPPVVIHPWTPPQPQIHPRPSNPRVEGYFA